MDYKIQTLDGYQELAGRTHDPAVGSVPHYAMGLCGESGEVADLLKKWLYFEVRTDRQKLVKELGDVLWYLSQLASLYGIPLSEVADTNISKLMARYPEGFVKGGGIR